MVYHTIPHFKTFKYSDWYLRFDNLQITPRTVPREIRRVILLHRLPLGAALLLLHPTALLDVRLRREALLPPAGVRSS